MAETRPHTREYTAEDRLRLGLAAQRAREAMGPHPYRPSFAKLIGKSVRSLVKLEQGEPVGPTVYEAAADHLPGWTRDTPRAILEGEEPPPLAAVEQADPGSAALRRLQAMSDEELAMRIAETLELEGSEAAGRLLARVRELRSGTQQRT